MSFTIIVIAQHGNRFATLCRGKHQSPMGLDAASIVLQTLLIFSEPSNRIAIEQELSFLSSLRLGDPIADYHNDSVLNPGRRAPFPFINTCLFLGMNGGVRDSLLMERSGTLPVTFPDRVPVSTNSFRRRCVTAIIDITNLDGLRYCFGANDHTTEDVLSYLTQFLNDARGQIAERYALVYRRITQALAKFELIRSIRASSDILIFDNLAPVGNPESDVPSRPTVKSLVDLCIAKILPCLAQSKNIDITAQEVLELPHIKTSIWEYCVENARTLAKAPHQASALLALVLKGETCINLAHFRHLAPTAVRHVLRSCAEARSINLSGTDAMADHEIKETLAAVDHDLDALYLLTPPHEIAGTLPKEIMRALRNWNHKCSKVLISSVLAEGSRGAIPRKFESPANPYLFHLDWTRTHYVGSRSFPITQIIYQSTFNNRIWPHSPPILAHFFIGGGFVSPSRLWTSILQTMGDMNLTRTIEALHFAQFLIHNLALGPPTVDSDNVCEVHSIPIDACFAMYYEELRGSSYSNPGYYMHDLTPDTWTAVVLRDEIPQDPAPRDGSIRRIDTDRFRVLLLQPKQVVLARESQSISAVPFQVMFPSLSSDPDPIKADRVLTSDRRRTVIQYKVGPHDVADAISAVQTVLNAAAAARGLQERLKVPPELELMDSHHCEWPS